MRRRVFLTFPATCGIAAGRRPSPGARQVPVELVVNGLPAARRMIDADGKSNELTFDLQVKKSSWIAVRVFPSGHTNPVFVIVDGNPIRANKKSAEWLLRGVDECWKQKCLVKVGSDGEGTPHPRLGTALQFQSADGDPEATVNISGYTMIPGKYDDGTPFSLRMPVYSFTGVEPRYFSVRLTPQLVGLGLLEAVPENAIVGMADPADKDGDGISGRPQIVSDPELNAQPRPQYRSTARFQPAGIDQ